MSLLHSAGMKKRHFGTRPAESDRISDCPRCCWGVFFQIPTVRVAAGAFFFRFRLSALLLGRFFSDSDCPRCCWGVFFQIPTVRVAAEAFFFRFRLSALLLGRFFFRLRLSALLLGRFFQIPTVRVAAEHTFSRISTVRVAGSRIIRKKSVVLKSENLKNRTFDPP
jgi:hypothetical protein